MSFQLVTASKGKPPGETKGYIWELFMDSVAIRTLPVALKLLPAEKRTEYRKWFAQHPVNWWKPDLIWSKWVAYLDKTNIANPDAW